MSGQSNIDINFALNQTRVVILLGAPFNQQNFERVGISELSKDFNVYVLDCNEWLNSDENHHKYRIENWNNHIIVRNIHDFQNALSLLNPSYAIDFIGLQNNVMLLEAIDHLQRCRINLVFQNLGPVPNLYSGIKGTLTRVIEKIKGKHFNAPIYLVNNKIPKTPEPRLLKKLRSQFSKAITPIKIRMRIPYIVIVTGSKTNNLLAMLAKHKIYAASNDFHTYHRMLASKIFDDLNFDRKYFLFIDDCLTSALDWKTLGIKPPVTDLNYFSRLNTFFDNLEDEYNLKVIVAGHPNTKGNTAYNQKFKGRSVIYDKTSVLAFHAEAVFCHASTAISFAILAKKPIYLITTSEIQSSFYRSGIEGIAKALGRKIIHIDKEFDRRTLLELPSPKKYASYISKYLKKQSTQELEPWNSFKEFVEKQNRRK